MITGNGKASVPRRGKSQNSRGTFGARGGCACRLSVCSTGMAMVVRPLLSTAMDESPHRRTRWGPRCHGDDLHLAVDPFLFGLFQAQHPVRVLDALKLRYEREGVGQANVEVRQAGARHVLAGLVGELVAEGSIEFARVVSFVLRLVVQVCERFLRGLDSVDDGFQGLAAAIEESLNFRPVEAVPLRDASIMTFSARKCVVRNPVPNCPWSLAARAVIGPVFRGDLLDQEADIFRPRTRRRCAGT